MSHTNLLTPPRFISLITLQGSLSLTSAFTAATTVPNNDADFPPLAPPSRGTSVSSLPGLAPGLALGEKAGRSTPPVPPGFEAHAHVRSESGNGSRRSTPTAPPGLTKPVAGVSTEPTKPISAVPADLDGLGTSGSSGSGSTPSALSRPSSQASFKRAASYAVAVPAIPVKVGSRPGTPMRVVSTPVVNKVVPVMAREEVETPTKGGRVKERDGETGFEGVVPKHVAAVKPEVATAAAPKTPATPAAKIAAPVPQTKQVHARDAETSVPGIKKDVAPKGMQPAAKGQPTTQASTTKAAPVTPSKPEPTPKGTETPAGKRKQPPGKLDIGAAVAGDSKTTAPSSAKVKDVPQTPASTTLKAESPSVASPATPAFKTAPKTLRVVAATKPDVTTAKDAGSAASTPGPTPTAVVPAAIRQPSRQPSVASININPPGTPSSEQVSISDNISITSTSQSRANSPPPNKVGSAPVKKTKGQLKKERQERAKAIEEEKAVVEEATPPATVVEDTTQEAIISRKKKTKKEKEPKPVKVKPPPPPVPAPAVVASSSSKKEATPTVSRPVTPQQVATPPAPIQSKPEHIVEQAKASSSKPPPPLATALPPLHLPSMPSPAELSPPPTPTLNAAQLNAASLIAELKATAPELQKCLDSLFRTPTSPHYKPSHPITAKDIARFTPSTTTAPPLSANPALPPNFNSADLGALLSRAIPALHYGGADARPWDRGMISPTGAHLRALTAELEQRFLELEKAIEDLPLEGRFRPAKPQNDMVFPRLDLEALKRGVLPPSSDPNNTTKTSLASGRGVSVMEQMVQDGSAMKKGAFLVDEASRYVNEFVMPPATPPPSAGGLKVRDGAFGGGGMGDVVVPGMSVEVLERQLVEARRASEEREGALRKVVRRNRKVLGMA